MYKFVYLAGGISGLTFEEATAWREELTAKILRLGHRVLNPLDGKEHLKGDGQIGHGYKNDPMCTAEAIFTRDTEDIMNSDILFVRLDTAKSIGTPFEMGYAYALRKKLIVVTKPELATHPFVEGVKLTYGNRIYTNYDKAVKELEKYLRGIDNW